MHRGTLRTQLQRRLLGNGLLPRCSSRGSRQYPAPEGRAICPVSVSYTVMNTSRDSELQGHVDGLLMRGGTSKGLFVRKEDLPIQPGHELFEAFLLELFGSP